MINQQAGNPKKNPDDRKTDEEPATGAQESYIESMADEIGEEPPQDLTKDEASEKIEELRQKTGRDS